MSHRLTPKAAQDLVSLTEYGIETFGQEQARKYHDALVRTFELLAEMPLIGRRDSHDPGYRRFLHGRHVIIYRRDESGLVIARVLHAAMDSPRHEAGGQ